MSRTRFEFDQEDYNHLFPFFILLDDQLLIRDTGDSMRKITGELAGSDFCEHFHILRPSIETCDYASIKALTNQLVLIQTKNKNCPKQRHKLFECFPNPKPIRFTLYRYR
mgnify:CR=1 FL=1